ncbi:MAG: NifB/NifX family molybdenum-iron cluster-binding protein [Pleomorphochaeta sp.]
MKIAVTYNNGLIEQHFGQAQEFKVYTIENNKIVDQEVVSTRGYAHGTLINLLTGNGVNTLICGGLGAGAREAVCRVNINLVPGVQGLADAAVNEYLNNSLNFDPDVTCAGGEHSGGGLKHSHEDSDESNDNGHTCSSH